MNDGEVARLVVAGWRGGYALWHDGSGEEGVEGKMFLKAGIYLKGRDGMYARSTCTRVAIKDKDRAPKM